MDFYAELIEARQSKNPEHRLQLLDYEKRKAFELRISELEAFIREHELTTQTKRDALSGMGNKYQPQVSVLLELQTNHQQCFHNHGEGPYQGPYDLCTGNPISHLLTVG